MPKTATNSELLFKLKNEDYYIEFEAYDDVKKSLYTCSFNLKTLEFKNNHTNETRTFGNFKSDNKDLNTIIEELIYYLVTALKLEITTVRIKRYGNANATAKFIMMLTELSNKSLGIKIRRA